MLFLITSGLLGVEGKTWKTITGRDKMMFSFQQLEDKHRLESRFKELGNAFPLDGVA
jgi:hypothetical protein